MGFRLIPEGESAESVRTFIERTHRTHFKTRIVTAVLVGCLMVSALDLSLLPAAIFFIVILVGCELLVAKTLKIDQRRLASASRREVDAIVRRLYFFSVGLTALYTTACIPPLFFPAPAPLLSVIFSTLILMNVAVQHVLHRRMMLFTLPAPASAFIISIIVLAGAEARVVFIIAAMLTLLHVMSLNGSTVRSYESLIDAWREARNQADARTRADAANVAKSNFIATMSHELRTPLNAIIGYSEILRETADEDNRRDDVADIDRVLSASRRLLHMINGVLDLSKIEAGRLDLEIGDADVPTIVREVVDSIRLQAEANGNQIRVDISSNSNLIRTDAFRLSQCLLNLLSNAAKFTHDGHIDIRVRTAGAHLVFQISDSGIGIPEGRIADLFQPFVQADASTTRQYGGTGLGLAITRRMAESLGGDLSATSAVGVGSVFTLTVRRDLRSLVTDEGDGPPLFRDPEGPFNTDGSLVLVVDDDAMARDLAARSLTRIGFKYVGAASVEEARTCLRGISPAMIVVDINLPGVSGWSFLEELAHDERLKDVPRLVVSVDDDRLRGAELGACAYLVKPVDRDVLASHVLRFARSAGAGERGVDVSSSIPRSKALGGSR
jgi:signal transduction histidine kinase/ActR/RegA family two-component response regulator